MPQSAPLPRRASAQAPGPSPEAQLRREIAAGLRRPQKELPCKYFYDEEGSRLFDRICELPEYYLTRAELAIMREHAAEMARRLGPDVLLFEYGSGSSVKTRLLLDELRVLGGPLAYAPVDISAAHLLRTAEALRARYPGLPVLPVAADFTGPFALPPCRGARRACYFPGSTIGNFDRAAAERLLKGIAARLGRGGQLLLGVDLKKDRATLEAAYNDAAGVTAAFNLNLLVRLNRELRADFQPGRFAHRAFYDEAEGRIEMHLVSLSDQIVHLGPRGPAVPLREGETLRTECSHKYDEAGLAALAAAAGFVIEARFPDAAGRFLCALLRVSGS